MLQLRQVFSRFWYHSVRRQIALAFSLCTLLLMLLFGFSIVQQERDFLLRQSLNHAGDLAHAVAVSSTSWVVANDVVGLQEVIRSVSRNPNVKYALVLSAEGRVLSASDAKQIGRFVTDSVSRHLLLMSGEDLVVLVDNLRQVDVAAPIVVGSRHVGWVRIGWQRSEMQDALNAVAVRAFLLMSMAVVVALLVARLLAMGLTSRLSRLITVANNVRGGRRDVRAEVAHADEVGILAGNFNRMLDALTESERGLACLNRVYSAWTACNDVIVSAKDEQAMLDRVCRIVAERVPFKLAWIGFADADGWVRMIAANDPQSDYINRQIKISVNPELPEGRVTMSRAIQSGTPQIHNDFIHDASVPWHAAAEAEQFYSVAAFPIRREGKCIGALAVYSTEEHFFNRDVVTLMRGLTDDLSYALDNFMRERLRYEAEEQLVLASRVFEHSLEGILITDADINIVSVNKGFTEITGYTQAEVAGKNPRILSSGQHDEAFYEAMWQSIVSSGSWQGEIWNRRKDGEIYPEWLAITSVAGESGKITHYIGVFSDITERKTAEQRIQNLAHYDALTTLPNRILLRDRLDQALIKAQRSSATVAVLFIDLDRFKIINDNLGHDVGDRLLVTVASRLLGSVREQDTVSRQGGDEFLVILPDTDENGAMLVAQKMLDALGAPFTIDGHDLRVTPSIGISMYPNDATDIDALIKLADVAMYHAKDNGRNNYQFYTTSMNASAYERMSLENGLRTALARNEFLLHYQPQVELATGRITGCEALIRWRHPKLGMVSPANFIPVAEECGLIVPIGEWVIREACRQMRAWEMAGLPTLTVAVNMSALQFRKPGLKQLVSEVLAETGIQARHLELELTESILMHGVDSTLAMLNELSALRLQLSIDDFGTGYSSLAYLKRFPIQKLKIDRSFVHDLATDANDAAIVRTIILMAHSLNLKVIAEGVETAEQLAFLGEAGCEEMQGYYFSRPLPADEFETLLRSEREL